MGTAYAAFHAAPNSFTWDWADWLGLALILIVLAFLITVIVSLVRGESGLSLLRLISGLLTGMFKQKKSG